MANLHNKSYKTKEQQAFYFSLKLSLFLIGIWFVIELIDRFFNLGIENWGVKPRSFDGLIGIFTFPFIHGDWQHLLSNGFSAFFLFMGIFIFHRDKSLFILLVLYLLSGSILWLIGRSNTNHIGASGLIYAMAFFLFVASIRVGDRNSMSVSFFIILMYGSMIWGLFPFSVEQNVSWDGHLSGAIAGIGFSLWEYRNYVRPKTERIKDLRPFFERFPLGDE